MLHIVVLVPIFVVLVPMAVVLLAMSVAFVETELVVILARLLKHHLKRGDMSVLDSSSCWCCDISRVGTNICVSTNGCRVIAMSVAFVEIQ